MLVIKFEGSKGFTDHIYKVELTVNGYMNEPICYFVQTGASIEATADFLKHALKENMMLEVLPMGEFEHPRIDLTFTLNSFYKRMERMEVWDNKQIV